MEERNIKISLGKAKEWYKQGGDLRQVALQAFSENELKDNFPESWDRYNTLADYKGNRVNAGGIPGSADYCHFATKEEAEAFVAFGKLIQLRDEYWKLDFNWKPNWLTSDIKYCIRNSELGIINDTTIQSPVILSFRTAELRNVFHKNFYNLIEEAKMFL